MEGEGRGRGGWWERGEVLGYWGASGGVSAHAGGVEVGFHL